MPAVEVAAGTIEYEDSGGSGPVLVLLHGLIMDGSLWRDVVPKLAPEYRCILPTLPLGAHRQPMRADADLSMGGIANILGEFLERLDLRDVTVVLSDWGGPFLLIGSEWDERIARLVVTNCEAFDNVPPQGAARALPYVARIPGGVAMALLPFRFDRLRRLPMTYGPLSKTRVPREVMDRWFGPSLQQRAVRRDLRKYLLSAHQGRRELVAATKPLGRFNRPVLVAWAPEDSLMPHRHAEQLVELFPQGQLVEVDDSYTLIPQDQPDLLASHMLEFLRSPAAA
ncbi:MAG: alpha/beta fold hydrolase [Solirubrobacterales bacterium]